MGQNSDYAPLGATAFAPNPQAPAQIELSQCPTCGGEFEKIAACPRDDSRLVPASPDPLRGVVLGGTYRIVRRVAVGGMGRVYEAKHERLAQRFAIKVLHSSEAHRPEAVQRLEREAFETSRLRSEHIVEVVDLLRTPDGRPCLVAEYLEGENLQERLDRLGRLDADRAVAIAIEICRGLAVAHDNRVIHRDLKPSNVFLVRAGERDVVKLVDFGVAKVDDGRNLTQIGAFVGTPAYMAPEQAGGAADLDRRADIYAVGAVLYHMVGGAPPFGAQDAAAALRKLLTSEPPRIRSVNEDVPPVLEAIIERAMAREPAARYATVDELCAELVQMARYRGKKAGTSESGFAAALQERRARWLRPIAIAALTAAALLLTAWAGALGRAVVFSFFSEADLGQWARYAFIGVPLACGLGILAAGIRRLVAGWRSAPRVQQLVAGVRGAVVWGMGLLACAEIMLTAWRAAAIDSRPVSHAEQAVALALTGLAAAAGFAWSQRRQR